MHDTSSEAAAVVRAAIQQRSPIDRMRDVLAWSETMREVSLARLRREYPGESQLELVERLTGESLRPGAPRERDPGP